MEPSFGRCVYVPKGGAIYRHFSQTQQLWRSWPAAAARTRRHEVVCSPRHLANRRERRAKANAEGLPLAASSVAFLGCCLCIALHSIRCCSCSATGQLTMPVRKYFLSSALVDQTCSTMGQVQRPRKLHAQAPHKKHVHRSWPTNGPRFFFPFLTTLSSPLAFMTSILMLAILPRTSIPGIALSRSTERTCFDRTSATHSATHVFFCPPMRDLYMASDRR
jgi:hypothetical protein